LRRGTLRRMIGASAAPSIDDLDPHHRSIPIETGIGRSRRNRAGIKGSVFDGRRGGEGGKGRLAGLRLEPDAEGPALGKEVTRATHASIKPDQPPRARPGGSQDRPGPEESRRTETVGCGEQR
jgi:hypothetical protein